MTTRTTKAKRVEDIPVTLAPLTADTVAVETDLQRMRDAYVAAHAIVSAPRYKAAAAIKTAITSRLKELGVDKTVHLDLGMIEVTGGNVKSVLSLDLLRAKYPEVFADKKLWVNEPTAVKRVPK